MFTEFLYRFWIENSIWYAEHEKLPLTLLQDDYRARITQKLQAHKRTSVTKDSPVVTTDDVRRIEAGGA